MSPEESRLLNTDQIKGDVFFIERTGDGYIFALDEHTAYNTMKNRTNWQRSDFAVIGTSDGSIFKKVLKENKTKQVELSKEQKEISKILKKYIDTKDRFLFEELLDEEDPKVQKVNTFIEQYEEKLKEVEGRIKNFSSDMITSAFNKELEEAKKHPRFPKNNNVVIPSSGHASHVTKDDVRKSMGVRAK